MQPKKKKKQQQKKLLNPSPQKNYDYVWLKEASLSLELHSKFSMEEPQFRVLKLIF